MTHFFSEANELWFRYLNRSKTFILSSARCPRVTSMLRSFLESD